MTDKLNDGLIQPRRPDSVDRAQIGAAVIFVEDPESGMLVAWSGNVGGGTSAPALTPLSRQTLALTGAAQALTVPAGVVAARISVRGGNASVAVAAPAPTATAGDLWSDGSVWELAGSELTPFRAITASGAPVLNITYLGVSP